MSEHSPQPKSESQEITTTETLDRILGSGIVSFVTKDGYILPAYQGNWDTFPSDLGTFFDGLELDLQESDLGKITTIHVYFGKNNQRTELEGAVPYGMIINRRPLLNMGELIALNFTQYNIDETLLTGLMKDSVTLLDQLVNFFPQCEDEPNIDVIRFLAPVIVDGFREAHLKDVVQQTEGSTYFELSHEIWGDWKRVPWGMGGARTWKFKTIKGSDEQRINSILIWILDQLDRFDIEFNNYMSIQGRTDFLAKIIDIAMADLDTFVGTSLEWIDHIEKNTLMITPATNQEQNVQEFFQNEMKRYIAKLTTPSLVRDYVKLLHDNKGDSNEFTHIEAFESFLNQTLLNTLDQGAVLPDDPRIYIRTQISSIFAEFRQHVEISSRGAFNALVTQTLESITEFTLPKIILDSGYLSKSINNILTQWSKNANNKNLDTEAQLTDRTQIIDVDQKDANEKQQILLDKEKILSEKSEILYTKQEQINSRKQDLDSESKKSDAIKADLNSEKAEIDTEKQITTQTQVKLDETVDILSSEDQQLAANQESIVTEKVRLDEKLSTVIANLETYNTEKADIMTQHNLLIEQESKITSEKDSLDTKTNLLADTESLSASSTRKELLYEQISTLVARENDLTTQKVQTTEQLNTFSARENELVVEKENAMEQLRTISTNLETLNAELERTNEGLIEQAVMEERLRITNAKVDDLASEKANVESQLSTINANLNKVLIEKSDMQNQINNLSANLESIADEKANVEVQISTLTTGLESSTTEKAHLDTQLNSLTTKITNLTSEKVILEEKLQETINLVTTTENTRDTLTRQIQEHEDNLKTVNDQIMVLDAKQVTQKQERSELNERINALKIREESWRNNSTKLHEDIEQLSDNYTTLQREKSEIDLSLSALDQDKTNMSAEKSSLNVFQAELQEKKDALESDQKALANIKKSIEQHIEFLGQKIEQEFGGILTYDIDEIRNVTQAVFEKLPEYFKDIHNLEEIKPLGAEWTVDLLSKITPQSEIACDFEEIHEHMKYWASPVGGIYPQRIEIFFTDENGIKTGGTLLLFQDQINRFSKRIGVTIAKGTSDGTQLLRDIRATSRKICEHSELQSQKDLEGEHNV